MHSRRPTGRAIGAIATVVAIASVLCLGSGVASADVKRAEKPAPPGGPALPIEGIPDALRLRMDVLDASPLGVKINMQTWDDNKQIIHVHSVVGNLASRAEVAAYLPEASFDITADKYSRKALVSSAEGLGNAALAAGLSGLRVSVRQASDLALLKPLLQKVSFPVTTEVGGRTYEYVSRLSDSAPFYGGARMYRQTSTGVTICTLGFKVEKGTSTAELTAAHCGLDDTSWYAGSGNQTNNPIGTMGPSNAGGADIRKITGRSYAATVWIGEKDDATTQVVKGKYTARIGDTGVCVDGSFTGQRCGWKVVDTDVPYCIDACRNQGVVVESQSHSGVIQEGDSGGPILKGTTGGALAGGVISAGDTSTATSCANGSGGTCFWSLVYAPVDAFLKGNTGWSVATG